MKKFLLATAIALLSAATLSFSAPDPEANRQVKALKSRATALEASMATAQTDIDAVEIVAAAAGDPRADDDPTPKLGFEELTPMIEGIQAADPMTAINLTLKGLSIDSALKRYDATWWDDAVEHEAQ